MKIGLYLERSIFHPIFSTLSMKNYFRLATICFNFNENRFRKSIDHRIFLNSRDVQYLKEEMNYSKKVQIDTGFIFCPNQPFVLVLNIDKPQMKQGLCVLFLRPVPLCGVSYKKVVAEIPFPGKLKFLLEWKNTLGKTLSMCFHIPLNHYNFVAYYYISNKFNFLLTVA